MKKRGSFWGFVGKMGVFVEKGEVLLKNEVLVEKWGFRGILVKKSGKSRKEPGI